jgi:hypothetical protein
MRSSIIVALAVSSGVLSTSGCYMDGAWRAPSWNNMTAWWRNPKTENTSLAGGPSVHLPSSASPAPGAAAPGAPSAVTASTQAPGVAPAYDATKASYTNVAPNMYPNTGMASFNTPGAGNRANTAAYDASSRGGTGYATGGPYDNRANAGHDYAQTGPYDTVYGGSHRSVAATASATPGVVQNPYASAAIPAQGSPQAPAITDRSLAASAQQDRYGPPSSNSTGANAYVPSHNDPRVAAREPAPATAANPVISPGTVRTRPEQGYDPGNTGYNPGNTGYQPPQGSGYDPAMNGTSATGQSPSAAAQVNQNYSAASQPSPRRESTWSPGGTSRYPGANPATATTAANTQPPATNVREPAPASAYRDPNAPDAPARTYDPSRYDDMR